jgi:D-lactate dehydrogenase (cytochrome)
VVFQLIGAGLEPTALELLNPQAITVLNSEAEFNFPAAPMLFMEFSGASQTSLEEELALVESICREYSCLHFQSGVGREARNRLWQARHRFFETSLRYYPGCDYLLTDVAVPISQFPALVAAANERMTSLELPGTMVGHAGDGNLHTAVFFPPDDAGARTRAGQLNDYLVERALALGGTCTGEHGVGLGKQKYMLAEHGPVALKVMRQLKAGLDPNGILNPGKVIALKV